MLPRADAVKSALILVNRAGCLNKTNQGCKSKKQAIKKEITEKEKRMKTRQKIRNDEKNTECGGDRKS